MSHPGVCSFATPPASYTMTVKRLPKRAKGKPWVVRTQQRVRVDGVDCWGYCDWHDREIVLAQGAEKAGVDRQVFLHEMIHKICPWMDEDAVDGMATELDDAMDVMGM